MATTHDDAAVFNQPVTFQEAVIMNGGFTPPTASITSAAIAVSADIDPSKLKHRHSKVVSQDAGTDVVDKTYYVHLARAAGTLKSVKVRPLVAPDGGDKQFTVDVKKVPNGSAVAAGTTLLTAPLAVSDADADATNKDAVLIGTPTYAAGDLIVVIIDATGSTGSQGQGVVIDLKFDESGV